MEQLLEEIVARCLEAGRVAGDNLAGDGSFIAANANQESRIPREQFAEAAQGKRSVRQYLVELEQQNPIEEPAHQQEQVSTTDPDATYATQGGTPARLGYYDNYLVDNRSCVIVGVPATPAGRSQETVAAKDRMARFAPWPGHDPKSVAADATYGNGEFLQWLMERGIPPYRRTRERALRQNNPLYGPHRFTYLADSNRSRCPAGEQLNYVGRNVRKRAPAYVGSRKRCGACLQKAPCTTGQSKYLALPRQESARHRARERARTPACASSQRERRKVEALFAELKHPIGLRRWRWPRMKFVRAQFCLAATAQNIQRLLPFLSPVARPPLPAMASLKSPQAVLPPGDPSPPPTAFPEHPFSTATNHYTNNALGRGSRRFQSFADNRRERRVSCQSRAPCVPAGYRFAPDDPAGAS